MSGIRSTPPLLPFLLAYRLAIHLDAVGVVNQPVQDAVGDGWIADLHMPALDRQLTCQHR